MKIVSRRAWERGLIVLYSGLFVSAIALSLASTI
jgi:hypothetical protein